MSILNSLNEGLEKQLEEVERRRLKEELQKKTVEDIIADGFSREMAETIYECEHGIDMEEVTWDQLMEDIDRCFGSSDKNDS